MKIAVRWPTGVRVKAFGMTYGHTLVVGDDGVAYGAGYGRHGVLPGTDKLWVRTLVPLIGLPEEVRATDVSAGQLHSLVLADDGEVYGSGLDKLHELTGAAREKKTLRPLKGLPPGVRATEIRAGYQSSLILGSNGVAYGAGVEISKATTGNKTSNLRPLRW